jgi:opacity protein-like surface antigen
LSFSGKSKNKIHAAFAGYLGAGYEFTKGVTGELSYSFRRLGALAKKNEGTILGHHVTAGVRFDI